MIVTQPSFPSLAQNYTLRCPGPEWVGDGSLLESLLDEPQDVFCPGFLEEFPFLARPDFLKHLIMQAQPAVPGVPAQQRGPLQRGPLQPGSAPAGPVQPAPVPAAPVQAGNPQTGYSPGKAVEFARSLKGRRSDSLHEASRAFWTPTGFHRPGTNLNDNNCANFVSGVLRKSGGLSKHQTGVKQLEEQLVKDGWTPVPAGQTPRPGDVWVGNDRQHVELVAQVDGQGQVKTVGSNNRTVDGESGQWVGERTKPDGKGFYLTPPTRGEAL